MPNETEEYLDKFIEKSVPRDLWSEFGQIVSAMRAGFYEGIKYQKEKARKEQKKQLESS